MGKRLTKIYTRTGDKGTTGLGDGSRTDKDDIRIEAIGDVDECNSALGMVLAWDMPGNIRETLNDIQHNLFDIGSELSIPGRVTTRNADIARLETILDELNDDLPYLQEFILPAGGPATSACHLARGICRRAERRVFSLSREAEINPASLGYLNRLSDLLFVIARTLALFEGGEEVMWRPGRNR